jgi:hypothetical protein
MFDDDQPIGVDSEAAIAKQHKLRWDNEWVTSPKKGRISVHTQDVTILTGKTPDSAVMTTRAGKYH